MTLLRFVSIALFSSALVAGTPRIPQDVLTDAYVSVEIPKQWLPDQIPSAIAAAADYPRAAVRSVQIKDLIEVYGRPSRLVRPKSGNGYSFLVYSLADGYTMLVYVPSIDGSAFAAAQLFRPDGQAEGPLLK